MKQNLVNVAFQPSESPWTGLRRASSSVISDAATQREEIPREKRVHLLRVTVKRLRAYLRMLQPSLEAEVYQRENQFLRDTGRSLSASRDRQVTLRTLQLLAESSRKKPAIEALRKAQELNGASPATRGMESEQDLHGKMSNVIAALQESLDRFSRLETDANGWELLEPGLTRTYRGARRRFRKWRKTADSLEAHDCRKLVKYLMFQLELLEPANQKAIAPFRKRLRKLERKLGQLNDCDVVKDFVSRACAEGQLSKKDCRRVLKTIRRREKEIASASKELGREALRKKTAPLVRSWETDWRRWTGA